MNVMVELQYVHLSSRVDEQFSSFYERSTWIYMDSYHIIVILDKVKNLKWSLGEESESHESYQKRF